ncbi:MAG: alpha/beta fold hydrolase [Gemmatimonadota bacterium]|nr:alpha/beta fold hydrolase [Gemmatimonadota bacterium]
MTVFVKLTLAVLVAYLLLLFFLWKMQDNLVFPGPHFPLPAPAEAGLLGELVSVTAEDGTELRGWFLPPADSTEAPQGFPTLVWFYGNMEGIGVLEAVFKEFRPPNMALFVMDYRGYGGSDGSPSERALLKDVDAVWNYVTARDDVDTTRMAIYGRSIGSVFALYAAEQFPVRAVVLDSPLSNARDMAARHYKLVPRFLLHLELDNLARAHNITAPLLVLHGSNDFIAPVDMGRAVAEAGRARELVIFEGAGHNDLYDAEPERYRTAVHDFLNSTVF